VESEKSFTIRSVLSREIMLDATGDLFFSLPIGWLLAAHSVLGLSAAAVAQQKGRDLKVWLPLGLICGTPALIVAILMKPEKS
jgi:hypothetical protein